MFVGPAPAAAGGNLLGVFLRGLQVAAAHRQPIATELGFSETVFIDQAATGALEIYTPATRLPFAGHPLVGASWLLAREGTAAAVLRPGAGDVPTWPEDGRTWIRGRAQWSPEMELLHLDAPSLVDAMTGAPPGVGFAYCWAWEDEAAGRVRARAFAPRVGIHEDEATGSAAIALGAVLGRPLRIRQGAGSELLTRPGPDHTVEVGGLVVLDEVREYVLSERS